MHSDIQTLEADTQENIYLMSCLMQSGYKNLVSNGVLNLMKDSFSLVALVSLMFYQNWKLAMFAILMMPLAGGLAKD